MSYRRFGIRMRFFPMINLSIALLTCGLLAPAARGQPAAAAPGPASAGGGPRALLITYRSEPADRPAFRAYLEGEGLARLERFKRDGVIQSYQVLFNPFTSSGAWDALMILRFARFADTRRWQEIERTAPGGLSPTGLRLAKPIDTYSADVPWEGAAEQPAADRDSVYYVIPYEYSSADQYRKYVDAYVIPQVKGWMREGVLGGYRIFMNRYPVGRPWDALFVYQYRDLESFGRRDEIVAKVRQTLVDDPAWKQFNEIKQSIRTESENTIAEALQPSASSRRGSVSAR
jgi:hypothetical protein